MIFGLGTPAVLRDWGEREKFGGRGTCFHEWNSNPPHKTNDIIASGSFPESAGP